MITYPFSKAEIKDWIRHQLRNGANIPELYIQREYFFYGKVKFKYLYALSIAESYCSLLDEFSLKA